MGRYALALVLIAGCGPETEAERAPSVLEQLCDGTEIESGIVGETELQTCDIGDGCYEALAIDVLAFETDPQIGGDQNFPGERDPDVEPIDMVRSMNTFELELDPGTYFICVEEFTDAIFCTQVEINPEAGILRTLFITGNGSRFRTRRCGD